MTGRRNLITDVPGVRVGNAQNLRARTGVTVIVPETCLATAVESRGGAPGTRETGALDPACLVDGIHGLVLTGGSVFGLAAADAVTDKLAAGGVGFRFSSQHRPCPVVPAAVLFDLANGGDKGWSGGDNNASAFYRALGAQAFLAASDDFALGNAGAGCGAVAGRLKGGLGSASALWGDILIGALVAVNSVGSPVNPQTGDLWARPFERNGEFGPAPRQATPEPADIDGDPFAGTKLTGPSGAGAHTTIAAVAVSAVMTKTQMRRVAIMAADGLARAIWPSHTALDGDTVFALAVGPTTLPEPYPVAVSAIGAIAGDVLTRAIGRAMAAAQGVAGLPAWRD